MRGQVRRLPAPALLVALLAGCATLGSIIDELSRERPPLPLDEASVASDARIDSTGALAASLVGEGASRQVHLLSSDTAFIRALVLRYRPPRDRRGDPFAWLEQRGSFAVNLEPASDSVMLAQVALVGSPDGHTRVRLRSILLHGPRCPQGEPQAEFIVEPRDRGGPSLRGPVVGSFRARDASWSAPSTYLREPPDEPGPALVDSLLDRTRQVMDSLLQQRLAPRDLPLENTAGRIAVNTLDDEDAADVLAFRLDDGRVRYAVSLREHRRTARQVDALAAVVMVWDGTLVWRQVVFRPTLLQEGRRGPVRPVDGRTRPMYWRRLSAISGFAFKRDYLWMEQVDVGGGQVRWVILEPKSNTIVAAADVEDGCH
jgi:hypothetical protein